MSSTPRAYQSKDSSGLLAGCTHALGAPVLPVVNFQIATSSRLVGAAASSAEAAATSAAKECSPGRCASSAGPTTSSFSWSAGAWSAGTERNACSVTASTTTSEAEV